MSDARQAVRAAQAAGADEHAPDAMAEARRLIDEAQQQLQYHEYRKAQRTAIDAREQALQALKTARQAGTSGQ